MIKIYYVKKSHCNEISLKYNFHSWRKKYSPDDSLLTHDFITKLSSTKISWQLWYQNVKLQTFCIIYFPSVYTKTTTLNCWSPLNHSFKKNLEILKSWKSLWLQYLFNSLLHPLIYIRSWPKGRKRIKTPSGDFRKVALWLSRTITRISMGGRKLWRSLTREEKRFWKSRKIMYSRSTPRNGRNKFLREPGWVEKLASNFFRAETLYPISAWVETGNGN